MTKHTPQHPGSLRPSTVFPWRIGLVVLVLSVTMIGVLSHSFHTGYTMTARTAPLIDATMEIKLEATLAHLMLEEILNGNPEADFVQVNSHLDNSIWYARAMLEGGNNPEGNFVPLVDEKLRREIRDVLGQIISFKKMASQRYEAYRRGILDQAMNHDFHALFQVFVNKADLVETDLQDTIARDLNQYRILQLALIGISIVFSLVILILIFHYENRRQKNLHLLEKTMAMVETNERWLSTVMSSMADGLITTDASGMISYMNKVAGHLTGYHPEEALNQRLENICVLKSGGSDRFRDETGPRLSLSSRDSSQERQLISRDGTLYDIVYNRAPIIDENELIIGTVVVFHDISEIKKVEKEQERLMTERQEALDKVKILSGFLPIWASCKKIRDDRGYWKQLEAYIRDHSEAEFSHSICPDCIKQLYPDLKFDK